MKCISPILLKDEKTDRSYYVPCGKCAWCRQALQKEWFFRFTNEAKNVEFCRFITLTYNDENLVYNVDEETGLIMPSVYKDDVKKFVKRVRNNGYRFRYFIASEYTPVQGRPHYHGLMFSHEKVPYGDFWDKGFHLDVPANKGSFKYVTKYILKGSNVPEGAVGNFRLMSRRPYGIGGSFVYKGEPYILTEGGVKTVPGHYYSRRYLNSLNDKLKGIVMDSKLDYLSTKDKYSDLYKLYSQGDMSIDFSSWLQERYNKDYKKQIKINSKNA